MARQKKADRLDEERQAVRRIYPTAEQLVLQNRLNSRRQFVEEIAAFDAQGRELLAIRPEELQDLKDRLNSAYGGGLIRLDLSA